MLIGWAINSAMIILAASAFFKKGINVTELEQAQHLLTPLLGGGLCHRFCGCLAVFRNIIDYHSRNGRWQYLCGHVQ